MRGARGSLEPGDVFLFILFYYKIILLLLHLFYGFVFIFTSLSFYLFYVFLFILFYYKIILLLLHLFYGFVFIFTLLSFYLFYVFLFIFTKASPSRGHTVCCAHAARAVRKLGLVVLWMVTVAVDNLVNIVWVCPVLPRNVTQGAWKGGSNDPPPNPVSSTALRESREEVPRETWKHAPSHSDPPYHAGALCNHRGAGAGRPQAADGDRFGEEKADGVGGRDAEPRGPQGLPTPVLSASHRIRRSSSRALRHSAASEAFGPLPRTIGDCALHFPRASPWRSPKGRGASSGLRHLCFHALGPPRGAQRSPLQPLAGCRGGSGAMPGQPVGGGP